MASPVAVVTDTHVGFDTYTLLTEAIVNGSRLAQVLSFFDPTVALPVSPAVGDRYISSATANGWTVDTIQYFNGEVWIEVDPTEGELTYVVGGGTFPATAILWNGAAWSAFGGGAGDVLGPGASVDNAVVRWDGATGALIQNSLSTLTDAGSYDIPAGENYGIDGTETLGRDANGNIFVGAGNLGAVTAATGAIAVGDGVGGTLSTGTNNVLIGTGADTGAASSDVIVIGNGASGTADDTIAIGTGASATAASAIAIGDGSSSTAVNAIAFGVGVSATEANAILINTTNSGANGGNLRMVTSDAATNTDNGGFMTVTLGDVPAGGTGDGGFVNLTTGSTTGSGDGGNVNLLLGDTGTGTGGVFFVSGGDGGTTGTGGGIILTPGTGGTVSGDAGDLTLNGGSTAGAGDGGDVVITPGTSTGGGADGVVSVTGALQMPVGAAVATTDILSVTSMAGTPTDVTGDPGGLAFDTTGGLFYVFDGAAWNAFAPTNVLTSESISIAGAGNDPDLGVATTFVSTTAAASGTLADGTVIGQIKYIVISAYVGDYVMTVTNGIDATGAAITTITYDSAGLGSTLTWDGTNWVILNTGGTIA